MQIKNRKKIIRTMPDGTGRKIEILFSVLYYSRLYCCFRILEKGEPRLCVLPFSGDGTDFRLENMDLRGLARAELLAIMEIIYEDSDYDSGQHFIWLSDKKEILPEKRILHNEMELSCYRFIEWYEHRPRLRKMLRLVSGLLILLILLTGAAAAELSVFRKWETLLQYRFLPINGWWISASTVRVTFLAACVLLCAALFTVLKKKDVKMRICASLLGIIVMSTACVMAFPTNGFVREEKDAEPAGNFYSLSVTRDPVYQDSYFGIVPGSSELEVPESPQFGDCLYRTTFPVWELPREWYQKLLETSLEYCEIDSEYDFERALENGEIHAAPEIISLWRCFLQIDIFWVWLFLYKHSMILALLWVIYDLSADYENQYEMWDGGLEVE